MGIIFKTSPRTITILEVYCGFKVHLSYYKRYLSSDKSLKKSRLERDQAWIFSSFRYCLSSVNDNSCNELKNHNMRLSTVQRCVFHILSITYNLGIMCRSGLRLIVKLPVPLTFEPALIFCVIFLQPTKQIQRFFFTLFPFAIACKVLQKYFQMSFLSQSKEKQQPQICAC